MVYTQTARHASLDGVDGLLLLRVDVRHDVDRRPGVPLQPGLAAGRQAFAGGRPRPL